MTTQYLCTQCDRPDCVCSWYQSATAWPKRAIARPELERILHAHDGYTPETSEHSGYVAEVHGHETDIDTPPPSWAHTIVALAATVSKLQAHIHTLTHKEGR